MKVGRNTYLDVLICTCLAVMSVVEVALPLDSLEGAGSAWLTGGQGVLFAVALWWRRTHPVASAVVGFAGILAAHLVGTAYITYFGQFVPIMIITFSVARYARARQVWLGLAMGAAALGYALFALDWFGNAGDVVWSVLSLSTAFLLGAAARRSAISADKAHQLAIRTEVEAAQRASRAVADERARIARELHDIVAHSVTSMVVLAGAAEQVLDDSPDAVRDSLDSIRATGNAALGEMTRLVSMLRETDELAAMTPQPGIGGVSELVEASRSLGLATELRIEGEPSDLPAGVGLTAYRVVQEALTNVRKHATASRATVRIRYDPDALTIDVSDDGAGPAVPPDRGDGGHGLVGMQERIKLYDGELRAGGTADGFTVHARLPLATL